MNFRIADTFTGSLARLTAQEQKAVKSAAFDLHLNPVAPNLKMHKLERAKDARFWSMRITDDIQLIVHKSADSLLLAYVDHHDGAYRWAERRKIEPHPISGAAQLIALREVAEEVATADALVVDRLSAKPALFAHLPMDDLLHYSVPAEWVGAVYNANEDTLLKIAEQLPQEAAEALLVLATGNRPQATPQPVNGVDPFAHPDAQRRFRVVASLDELQRALEYPWEKWAVFLHPSQRQLVEGDYAGPVRVSGSAGTGKTVVALHRAVHLARRYPHSRVLLTTFSEPLAHALQHKLVLLAGDQPRIVVRSIRAIARELYTHSFSAPTLVSQDLLLQLLEEGSSRFGKPLFSSRFLLGEWAEIVDAWQLRSWESYRDVPRLGRKTRLGGKQREMLWSIFVHVQQELSQRNLVTWPEIFARISRQLANRDAPLFDFAVVDEAQDMGVAEIGFFAGLGGARTNSLFFTGDLGQRIMQQPFSWKALGVEVRGRSQTLRVNYRTSQQIRHLADRLLPTVLSDVDGNSESRVGTISLFNGPVPTIHLCHDAQQEAQLVAAWMGDLLREGLQLHEIAVFVRDRPQMERAKQALSHCGSAYVELDERMETLPGHIVLATMHLAKGLEFPAVVVMACDEDVIPLQERIEAVTDESDLEEVYNTERHLLYVACTRARDHLLLTGVDPASEFLADLIDTHAQHEKSVR
ncbi:3'-5' exonuclease [Candidatus Magnetaquicoccus inordinatus]|uniref:3'-5' exonuclease n=1 Tax=Candidatus Magnetaquicoccus inordinatus TaxID=2496818 RepID=UPI00102CEEEF|nr:3'-5' exonuclease [Candidatus Magnetaquicoccus inordinatus]